MIKLNWCIFCFKFIRKTRVGSCRFWTNLSWKSQVGMIQCFIRCFSKSTRWTDGTFDSNIVEKLEFDWCRFWRKSPGKLELDWLKFWNGVSQKTQSELIDFWLKIGDLLEFDWCRLWFKTWSDKDSNLIEKEEFDQLEDI